jgi:adhesin transport system membrane fusion protein
MARLNRTHPDDAEFMSEVSAATLESAHRAGHSLLILSLAFFIAAGWWAYETNLDEVTRGEGKVIPSSKIQVIQNLEGGILADVMVAEGQVVEKDQVLLKIDDTRFSSSVRETELKYYELLARSSRLKAESDGVDFIVPEEVVTANQILATNEKSLYLSRQRELHSALQVLKQQLAQRRQELIERRAKQSQLVQGYKLSDKELKMSEPLVDVGVISEVEVLRLKRTVNQLYGEMEANRLAIPRTQSALSEAQQKVKEQTIQFKTDAATQYSEVNAELSRVKETIFSAKDRVTRTQVRSPLKGTIKQLKINTVGGIIQPGMDLLEIVPIEDNLLIEAKIRPSDIAFLRPGQEAMVKLTAYDFSIYGGLPAKLERISADTIKDDKDESFYLIYLRTDKNYIVHKDVKLNIIPGMTTTVDILTGKKTVLDYLLKPIFKAKNEALRER